MPTPTRSWAQTWGRMPAAAQAWIIDVVGKQLRNLTPSCFRMVAIASTIFMGCPPYLRRLRWPHAAEALLLSPGLRQGPRGDYRRQGPWSRGRGAPACYIEIDAWAACPMSPSLSLLQRCRGLGEPEGHVHGTVEGNGGGEGSMGLLPLAGHGIQGAEAAVAVGLERAHTEFVGQGEGLPVVVCSCLGMRGIAMCSDRAEEVQRIRFVAPLLVLTGERQRALGEGVRLLQTPGQHLRLAQGQSAGRVKARRCRRHGLFHRQGEELHGVGDAPREEI